MSKKIFDDTINNLLKFDPVDFVEKNFEDGEKIGLALSLSVSKNAAVQDIMRENEDSYHSMKVEDYLKVVQMEGFEPIFTHHFANSNGDGMETMYIMYKKPEGILLVFDTYYGNVNSGNFYYNWVPKNNDSFKYTASYSSVDLGDGCLLIAGYHDCREAIRFKIRMLKEHGEFLQNWVKRPFLWLLCHGDRDKAGEYLPYEEINEKRISAFPEGIRKAITPVGEVEE